MKAKNRTEVGLSRAIFNELPSKLSLEFAKMYIVCSKAMMYRVGIGIVSFKG